MHRHRLAALLSVAFFATIAAAGAQETPPPTLIAIRGVEMPERQVLRQIGFRPFVPAHELIDAALLPPYHGDDSAPNRGIGYEYEHAGRTYALFQWPANGGSLSTWASTKAVDACKEMHLMGNVSNPYAMAWMTPHNQILMVQIDGKTEPRALRDEATRLIRRGACR